MKALCNEPFKLIRTLGVWQHGEAPCKNCPRVNFYQEARELEGEELTLKSGSAGSLGGRCRWAWRVQV